MPVRPIESSAGMAQASGRQVVETRRNPLCNKESISLYRHDYCGRATALLAMRAQHQKEYRTYWGCSAFSLGSALGSSLGSSFGSSSFTSSSRALVCLRRADRSTDRGVSFASGETSTRGSLLTGDALRGVCDRRR